MRKGYFTWIQMMQFWNRREHAKSLHNIDIESRNVFIGVCKYWFGLMRFELMLEAMFVSYKIEYSIIILRRSKGPLWKSRNKHSTSCLFIISCSIYSGIYEIILMKVEVMLSTLFSSQANLKKNCILKLISSLNLVTYNNGINLNGYL